jgi:esterase
MELAFRQLGEGAPLVILHGLYGSSDNWYSIGKELAKEYTVYLTDQRNHGRSPHSNVHNYKVMADDLFEFFDKHNLNKAIILGHSMGGKTAMLFALQHPQMVHKLVVADIAPKAYTGLAQLNTHSIEHLNIMQGLVSVNVTLISSRKEVEKNLGQFIPDERIRQFLLKNLYRDEQNRFQWRINVEALRRNLPEILAGIDIDKNSVDQNSDVIPVLFIKGEKSDYIDGSDFSDIKNLFPLAEIVTVQNAGHWLHAEQPQAFLKCLHEFFLH